MCANTVCYSDEIWWYFGDISKSRSIETMLVSERHIFKLAPLNVQLISKLEVINI